MQTSEIEKAKLLILLELIEYVPNSVISKTIIQKVTGSIRLMAFDYGEALAEKVSPFDTFIQVIEGSADIIIDQIVNSLESGQAIIIPANAPNMVKATRRAKMISTMIKSGYEGNLM